MKLSFHRRETPVELLDLEQRPLVGCSAGSPEWFGKMSMYAKFHGNANSAA